MSTINQERTILTKPAYGSLASDPYFAGPFDEVQTVNLTVNTINGQSYPPPPGTGFVTLTGVETLSNKSLIDSSTYIIDAVNPNIKLMFDAAGAGGTTATIRASNTGNRIYNLPDPGVASTDVILAASTQSVTGAKQFAPSTLRSVSSGDNTVYTTWTTAASPAGTVTTIATAAQTGSRTYIIPDAGASTEVLLGAATQNVTGTKTFIQSARMANISDPSIYMRFMPGASPAGTVTTIATAVQTGSRTYTIPDSSTNTDFVLAAASQTLSNKNFQDSGTFIVDIVDPTIRVGFDAAGATGSTLTLRTTNTTSRIYTMPDMGANTSFVFTEGAQTISNKAFDDATTTIVASGGTAAITFESAGTAGTTATIRAQQTANRAYLLPNINVASDTFIMAAQPQNLTNKTLTATSNDIAANKLRTTTGVVGIGGATAPTVGQVLTATSATAATWQTPVAAPTTFSDATFEVYDSVDNTIQFKVDAAGTTGTSTTITTSQTANSVFTFPNTTTTDQIVLADATQNLTNKGFAAGTTYFYTEASPTKRIAFDPSGLNAGITYTIRAGSGNVSRTFTIPGTPSDTFAMVAATQTFTNKTITDVSNTVTANSLRTATAAVSVGSAAAPSAGQVLTATNATTATWQTPVAAPTTFSDATFAVYDSVDNTIQLKIDAAGTTGTTATIRTAQTTSLVYTIPDASANDSFVLLTPAQTLTNKTITDPTNTVAAKQLVDATGVVDVSASAAPTAGQVLTATSATTATWQTPAAAPTTFSDATFAVYDSVDNTIQFKIDAAGTTGTTATIRTAQTTSLIYTIPNASADDSFVLASTSQSLTNKNLVDNTTFIIDSVDNTKTLGFDIAGTTGTSTTLACSQTANRIITIPSGAVAASVMLTEGAQTANGVNTFSAGILTPTITETVANAGTTVNDVNIRTIVSGGVNVSVVAASTAVTNATLSLVARGTGAITAQIPNNAVSGGNARGTGAVDFQTSRTSANQVASGINSALLGGDSNRVAASSNAIIGAGTGNIINGSAAGAGIFCGATNTVSASAAQGCVLGGARNTVSANNTGVLAGDGNTASTVRAVCVGGLDNTAAGQSSITGAGENNQANSTTSGVFTGNTNVVSGISAAILGGNSNTITSCTLSAIIAGSSNSISTNATGRNFIGSGNLNNINSNDGGIVSGTGHSITAARGFIGGGQSNTVAGSDSAVLSGSTNQCNGSSFTSVICGGLGNLTSNGSAGILAGQNNTASGQMSAVLCGQNNQATTLYSIVAGGNLNVINAGGTNSFIGGGSGNTISTNTSCAIIAGSNNGVTGLSSLNGAGTGNTVSGQYAFNAAGSNNTASALSASTIYGTGNIASAQYTLAGGVNAQSTATGCLTFTDSTGGTVTNATADRMVTRFTGGYRMISSSPFRLNNVVYTYSNLFTGALSGSAANTIITNSTITLPSVCSFRFKLIMNGVPNTPGAVLPAGNPFAHSMVLEGYGSSDPAGIGNAYFAISTGYPTTETNSTNVNVQGTSLNMQAPTATTVRFRISSPGVYDVSYKWAGSVTFWYNDLNAVDPT